MGYARNAPTSTLETKALEQIVDYEKADLTIAAQAGVSIRTIASLLAQNGQFVPFDAPRPQYATLGGTLAAGWLGPRRHIYGRPRDYILGSIVVLADGTIAKAGGMVVKNVAGYDAGRLYAGSFRNARRSHTSKPKDPGAARTCARIPRAFAGRHARPRLPRYCKRSRSDQPVRFTFGASTTQSTARTGKKAASSSCSRKLESLGKIGPATSARRSAKPASPRRALSTPGARRIVRTRDRRLLAESR